MARILPILTGLIIVQSFAVTAAIVGPQNRPVPGKMANVLGPVADLEIVNKVISPDGFPRS